MTGAVSDRGVNGHEVRYAVTGNPDGVSERILISRGEPYCVRKRGPEGFQQQQQQRPLANRRASLLACFTTPNSLIHNL